MKLLVSMCNLPQPDSSGLLAIERANGSAVRIDIGAPPGNVRGCVGLWAEPTHLYCAWIAADGGSYVSVLVRPYLQPVEVARLDRVQDVHSICVAGSFLYVVSTGTDEVRRLPVRNLAGRSEHVWSASPAGRDTHHVNSILPVDGRLLCSAFGPKMGERWSTALAGYVVDVISGAIVASGIEHPHSLTKADDLYVAESRRARVRGLAGHGIYYVEGYARGIGVVGDELAIGVSQGRARSRSLGTIENADDPGERTGETGLVFLRRDRGNPQQVAIDLASYGPEIYDVLVLN